MAVRTLEPEGKPHPPAKVFLLFEKILVPGSHPKKFPESAPEVLLPQKYPRRRGEHK